MQKSRERTLERWNEKRRREYCVQQPSSMKAIWRKRQRYDQLTSGLMGRNSILKDYIPHGLNDLLVPKKKRWKGLLGVENRSFERNWPNKRNWHWQRNDGKRKNGMRSKGKRRSSRERRRGEIYGRWRVKDSQWWKLDWKIYSRKWKRWWRRRDRHVHDELRYQEYIKQWKIESINLINLAIMNIFDFIVRSLEFLLREQHRENSGYIVFCWLCQ